MKVVIKDFSVEMKMENKGIEFHVNDNNGEFEGDNYCSDWPDAV